MIKQNKNYIFFFGILLFLNLFLVSAGELKVTEEHPFLINGSWVPASDLKVGDILQTADGKKVRITKLTDIVSEENFSVYNLEAGVYHDFVVDGGDGKGVVVHNSNNIRNIPFDQDYDPVIRKLRTDAQRGRRFVDKADYFKAKDEGLYPYGETSYPELMEQPWNAYNQDNGISLELIASSNDIAIKYGDFREYISLSSFELWQRGDDYLFNLISTKRGRIDEDMIKNVGKLVGLHNGFRTSPTYPGTDINGLPIFILSQTEYKLYMSNPHIQVTSPISSDSSGVVVSMAYESPDKISSSISSLIIDYNNKLLGARSKEEIIDLAADFEREFVSIHPFTDQNGRTGRLFMDYILQSHGLPPAQLSSTHELTVSSLEWRKIVREGVQNSLENSKFNFPVK